MLINETDRVNTKDNDSKVTTADKSWLDQNSLFNVIYSSNTENDTKNFNDYENSTNNFNKVSNYNHSTLEWLQTWRSIEQ